eukprot:4560162-Lingulodinium_polyedra.AAC.1
MALALQAAGAPRTAAPAPDHAPVARQTVGGVDLLVAHEDCGPGLLSCWAQRGALLAPDRALAGMLPQPVE